MTMIVKIYNYTNCDIKYFCQIIKKIFSFENEKRNMHLIFIKSVDMKKMNLYYCQKDYTTDVLSFPNHEEKDSLGDVFINLQKAKIQAKKYNHSLEREIGFLSVHGYLHLKGYQHFTKNEFNTMMNIQEKMLKKVNVDLLSILYENKRIK